jgi:MFS transporter, DHA1 family, tetracycline resistance protein
MPPRENQSFLPVFFTVFIDLLGLSIVIPILAPLFLNASDGLLPVATAPQMRTILLGFLLATYPIAQFFGSPFLGGLSDRVGRKKVLLLSLLGTSLGYILFAIGVLTKNLPLIFFSRALDGFTGGNISTALSAIADVSDERSRAKNFGLLGMAFGLGFIMGPYIGGKISDPSVVPWFNYSTPLFLAALLAFLNALLVFLRFRETLKEPLRTPMSLLTGFRNLGRAFTLKHLRVLFLVIFLLTFGFNFFIQFFQVFLIGKFQFSQSQVGDLFAYIGIWIAVTQGLVNPAATKRFSSVRILSFSLLGLAIIFPFLLLPGQIWGLYLLTPFIAIFQGLIQPNSTALVSRAAEPNSQGELLGIGQSLQAVGQAIPPIIAGFIVNLHPSLPTLVAAGSTLLAWLIFVGFFPKDPQTKFEEI